MYNELNNSNNVIAVFLDLAKAFDTMNHIILLQILPSFGIDNYSLNLFESYLFNIKQIFKINDVTRKESIIEHGVHQGSVLGLILFILYINLVLIPNEFSIN